TGTARHGATLVLGNGHAEQCGPSRMRVRTRGERTTRLGKAEADLALKAGCRLVAPSLDHSTYHRAWACHVAPRDLAALVTRGRHRLLDVPSRPLRPCPNKILTTPRSGTEVPISVCPRPAPWRRVEKALFADDVNVSNSFRERNVMECRRDDDGLFRLDVGHPDHPAPFFSRGNHFSTELGCQAGNRNRRELQQPPPDPRVRQRSAEPPIRQPGTFP